MNRKCVYLAEGECEEKLLKALKDKPSLITPGKVKRFNAIQNELKTNNLVTFSPGSMVVIVFDTDKEITAHLKKNIELLNSRCKGVKVVTIAQVLNFEDEIVRSTDVAKAEELTKSKSIGDFKSAVNKMKESEFRHALERHHFNIEKLWKQTPPETFGFVVQGVQDIIEKV